TGPTESIAIGQRKYELAKIAGGEGERLTIVVKTLPGMGSVQAGIATTQAILDWEPYYIVLSGIAGGHKASDRQLGDLVIAQQIVGYELGKLQAGVMKRRVPGPRPAPHPGAAPAPLPTPHMVRGGQSPPPLLPSP